MIKSYFQIVIRHFLKEKLHAAIIITGLAIGIASALIIAQYIYFESSFDKDVPDRDNIYYAYIDSMSKNSQTDGLCFPALGPFAEHNISQIESSVRIVEHTTGALGKIFLRREENGKVIFYAEQTDVYLADPNIFKFFSMHLLKGDEETALKRPNTVVITKNVADKFFPNEDPINKILTVLGPDLSKEEATVTGVIADPPKNSSIQFSVMFSLEITKISGWNINEAWYSPWFKTYFKLREGSNATQVEQLINKIAEPMRKAESQLNVKMAVKLSPFRDYHFFRHRNNYTVEQIQFTGDKRLLTYFGILGTLIMLVSWANYINLTTARAISRAKEVGLRKVSGASRKNLIGQFFLEYLFINVVSFLLALTMTQLLFDVFANIIGSNAEWIFWSSPIFWAIICGLIILSTVISGVYPALVISDYKPAKVLKGNFARSQSGVVLRKGLVIFQFGLSVFMIMSIYVISKQLFFMQQKDLGISVDQIVVIPTSELDKSVGAISAFKQLKMKLEGNGNFKSFSASLGFPGERAPRSMVFNLSSDASREGKTLQSNAVGENYFTTMGIRLLHGRDFLENQWSDSSKVIINEKAAFILGFKEPSMAIGEKIRLADNDSEFEIIGIVNNFDIDLKAEATGEIFFTTSIFFGKAAVYRMILIKLSSTDVHESIDVIKTQWKNLLGNTPFDFFFLDDYFDTFYKQERQFAGVFGFFAIIGIAITCMGLFGLSLYDTSSRNKEIGIRKTLGATVSGIIWMFSKDYIKLVLMAALIGIPLGYFALKEWLDNYPQHITLQIDAMLIPMLLMCLIAVLTVGYHTFKTARINPVNSLRND
ncbi:MAG: ABC transporter permease [Chryseolinea sp.]